MASFDKTNDDGAKVIKHSINHIDFIEKLHIFSHFAHYNGCRILISIIFIGFHIEIPRLLLLLPVFAKHLKRNSFIYLLMYSKNDG